MKKTILIIVVGSVVLLISALISVTAQQPQGAVTSPCAEMKTPQMIVVGAVVLRTRIVLRRRARLAESLTSAGGLTKKAKGVVQLIHADGTFHTFRYRDIKGDDTKANPYLQAGDVISVF